MAVLREWRHRGVGKALMAGLLNEARMRGWTTVSLNAQVPVLGFYEQFGFHKEGEIFMEAGIPHKSMRLQLRTLEAPERRPLKPGRASVAAVEFDRFDDAVDAALRIIYEARRNLVIHAPDLEYPLYGHPDVIAAFRQFAIQNRDSCARLIVQNATGALGQSHPLLELAQKLPSSFQFRTPVEAEDLKYSSA